ASLSLSASGNRSATVLGDGSGADPTPVPLLIPDPFPDLDIFGGASPASCHFSAVGGVATGCKVAPAPVSA
ncbi:MAG: hypothetical protein HQL28_07105, partial [Candidatus Omnitrophica bacterium]|nr:hypothetical protein [Candidatus Omnitrophota bacterium]